MGDPAAVRHYELLRTYLEQTPLAAWMLMPRMRGGLERSAWRSVSENKHDSGNNNDEHDIININSHRSAAAAAAAAAGSSSTPSNYFGRAT